MEIPNKEVAPLSCSHDFNGAVIGMVLGDSWMESYANSSGVAHDPRKHKTRLQFGHCLEQKEYLLWKVALTRNYLVFNHIKDYQCVVKGTTCYTVKALSRGSRKLSYLYPKMYQFKKKLVSRKILNRLTPLGLAIWYMDDGYLEKKSNGKGGYYPGRAIRLSTESFTYEGVLLIQKYFQEVWEIPVVVVKCTSGHWVTWFNNASTKKFLDIVRPYVLQVECMKHKLPEFSVEAPEKEQDIVRAS